jgi:hypothetical protein
MPSEIFPVPASPISSLKGGHGHHGHGHNHHHAHDLFGGKKPWDAADWTAQDDRLRGGSSVSNLTVSPIPPKLQSANPEGSGGVPGTLATFHGVLDTTTLGGAGFASQRTVGDDCKWDLSDFEGIEIEVIIPPGPPSPPNPPPPNPSPPYPSPPYPSPPYPPPPNDPDQPPSSPPTPSDNSLSQSKHTIHGERIFTIVLKDSIQRGEPDAGKEISWEWNFKPSPPKPRSKGDLTADEFKSEKFHAKWSDFKPFYRGREDHDEKGHVHVKDIKRFNIMIRSFFQKQQDGPFSLAILGIRAIGHGNQHHGHGHRDAHIIPGNDLAMAMPEKQGAFYDEYDPAVDGADSTPAMNEKGQAGKKQESIGWFGRLAAALCG